MSGVAYDVGSWRLGDDGCIHRRGRMRFSNGDVYDGEWVNGKRHGKGTLRFADGGSYMGDFVNNFFEGFGLLTVARRQHPLTKKWIPGEKYDGEFRRSKRHGKGTGKNQAGETYDGEYQHGTYHGRGVCAYANGETYDGQWIRGKWHGHGELRRRDGSIYAGDFVNGLFHGYGKLTLGSHGFYAGDYRFGLRHGKGVRVFGNGKKYEGDWRDDVIDGVGVMESEAFKYVGEFSGGKFHGHGVVSYASGDSYEGSFSKGDLEGRGSYTYSDGGEYEGEFKESKKHGRGRRVFSTGDVYDGDWREDLMHGHGVVERRVVVANGCTASYCYEGAFHEGHQTGHAVISYAYRPKNADELFEWKDEYEFPMGSGLWHCGRGASMYKGDVCRGAFHGHGELRSPDGRRWCGEWREGQLHGIAECVYLPLVHNLLVDNEKLPLAKKKELAVQTTGLYRLVRYDGEFVKGIRHGRGRLLFENGDWICGEFGSGFASGVVTYRFSTGKERHAEFKNGHRVRWLSQEEEDEIRERETAEREAQAQSANQRRHVLRAMMA